VWKSLKQKFSDPDAGSSAGKYFNLALDFLVEASYVDGSRETRSCKLASHSLPLTTTGDI